MKVIETTLACLLLLLFFVLPSLTPVLTDNLSRFYFKAICRLDKLVACTTVWAGYYFALYRVSRHLNLCITFWTLYHISYSLYSFAGFSFTVASLSIFLSNLSSR